jgi:hypothetical protein
VGADFNEGKKLLGHNNDSTKPPQWLAMGPKGAIGKTYYIAVRPHATALQCAVACFHSGLAAHTRRQKECVQCVACECRVCVLRVTTGLVGVVMYIWSGLFFCCCSCGEFLLSGWRSAQDQQEKIERVCCLSACLPGTSYLGLAQLCLCTVLAAAAYYYMPAA